MNKIKEVFSPGKHGKFQVKTMKLSYDKQFVWMDGVAQVSNQEGEEVSGSDFFKFDMTIRGKVEELDESLKTGMMIDIEYDGRFWKPIHTESIVEYVDKNPCNGECKKCEHGTSDGMCSMTG